MLASERRTPFTHEDFVYEIKYDGWRCLSGADRGRVELRTRNGANCSKWFPEISQVLAALKGGPHVLDGEAAVLDDIGRSDFNRMHARAAKRRWDPLNPVAYCAFDLLVLNGTSVMDRTYEERKALLFELLAPLKGKLVIVGYLPADASVWREIVLGAQLEGVVAKEKSSLYLPGVVSKSWQKIKRPGWNKGRRWKN